MTNNRRLLRTAALTAAACLIATQVSGLTSASARSGSLDGGPSAAAGNVDHSQTPLQVRTKTAKLLGAVKGSDHLRLTLGLKPRDVAGQQKLLDALQDRNSPLFHHYLSAAQWNARFAPTAASEAAVLNWAGANGLTVSQRYPNRLLVDIDSTASAIEAALHVTINNYSLNGHTVFSNAADPKLPSAISSIVSSVEGLNNIQAMVSASGMTDTSKMPRYSTGAASKLHAAIHKNGSIAKLKAAMAKKKMQPNISHGFYDPSDIYSSQAYDTTALLKQSQCCNPFHVAGGSPAQSSIAIITAGSHAFTTDMAGFGGAYGLAYNLNEYYIDGTPSTLDYEGTMDTEWSTALANSFGSYLDTAHVYVYSGVNANFSTFDDMYNRVLSNNTAKVVSSSWGCAEVYCTSDGTMNTDHAIFDAMSAQGFTMVNSSGDRGAYADCAHVSVSYPASDPDWLGIGATNLELSTGPVYVSQTAWGDVGNCSGNGGGSGGGCSAKYAAPTWQTNTTCGTTKKAVPDLSLNGDWANSPQNVYFNGGWSGNGGTSISAPMMGGFYAQQNSYGISLGSICGGGSSACAPIGQGGRQIYLAAQTHGAQGKNPFYDITSGCTTNEIGSGYCGIAGYDRASGWGTPNMLQLAWANNYWNMPEASPPSISLTGPSTSGWVNTGTVSWTIADAGSPPSGVSGWTAKWDADPGDPSSHVTPGSGDSFYSGPASAHGSTSGSVATSSGGEGCHTLYVRAWDNIGESAVNTYGPVCYDGTAPTTPAAGKALFVKGTALDANNNAPVRIQWGASTDALSGFNHYQVWQSTDGAAYTPIANPTTTNLDVMLAPGHKYQFAINGYDNAGNAGAYVFNPAFKLQYYQENASAITYSGTWATQNVSWASGGHLDYTSTLHAKATFTFSGKGLAWVGVMQSNRGMATTTLDGVAGQANANSATTINRALVYTPSVAPGSHTLVIDNRATAGHPRIDLDAFLVIKAA